MRSAKVEHKRPFTQKDLKEAAKRSSNRGSPIRASAPPPTSLTEVGIGCHSLARPEDLRLEMLRVYNALSDGQISKAEADSLVWMLDTLRRAKLDESELSEIKVGRKEPTDELMRRARNTASK